jgi:hypothetical protein
MSTVKVWQYNYTHPTLGMPTRSKRMATRDRIELMGGWPVEGTEIEVDESKVVNGQTEQGFVG